MAVLKRVMAAAMLALAAVSSAAATPEQETLDRLARMRAMPAANAGQEAQQQRRDLDAAWRWFGNHRTAALPVLRRELAAELKKPQPSQLVLLDVGYFLRALGDPADRALSMRALLAIDPAGIVPRTQG